MYLTLVKDLQKGTGNKKTRKSQNMIVAFRHKSKFSFNFSNARIIMICLLFKNGLCWILRTIYLNTTKVSEREDYTSIHYINTLNF